MLRKTFPALLAVCTVFGTSFLAASIHPEDVAAYASASLEDRVEQRRLERLGGQSSSSSAFSRILRTVRTSSSRSSATLETRVEQRLRERLEGIRVTEPEEYKRIVEMLRRREQRRAERQEALEQERTIKEQVMDAVNMERAKRSIPALRYHPSLETSAQLHAQDMRDRDFFSHENPEGLRSGDRIKLTGYGNVNAQECRCSYRVFLGENIAKGQTTVAQVISEWMASDSHREAMLSKDYTEIGVGIVGDIWVLNFGSVQTEPVNN